MPKKLLFHCIEKSSNDSGKNQKSSIFNINRRVKHLVILKTGQRLTLLKTIVKLEQILKKASAAHFYYRGHFSKNANYTRWSNLGKAEQTKWTEEWAKIREVQKVQAAQGLIVLRSQIKDEVEDGPKWAMTLRKKL
ncbi:hypothetical protein B9Z55_023556 [Caenorhabditis nigoni]|nr:hypothetical protein B9Z55_023552 [Caenorhabditis nigoni]PIC17249.1 hypothetical protein B9Z55_023556 [Caenorhabditis nigoni]